MTPLEFLQLLWPAMPKGMFLLIWTLADKRSHWFRRVDDAGSFVQNGKGNDVYVGIALSPSDNGEHHRCSSEAVAAIPGFGVDFDLQSPAHSKKPLPTSVEEALSLIPADLPPTIVVATGNGVHAWWLFQAPWVFQTAEERQEAAGLSARFQTLLQYKSTQRGWTFERLGDLARVLRIPGTINAKDPKNLKPVEVHSLDGRRYTIEQIRGYLDRLSIPDAVSEQRTKEEFEQRFTHSPLVVNLKAEVRCEQLDRWCNGDPRFRQTWNRERDNLRDQSASGYDMALASFGVQSDLSDQEIVDLIVHHRRLHGDQQRKAVDYFQRTIGKARKTEAPSIAGVFQSNPPPEGPGAKDSEADGGVRKAQICDRLSSLLGVRILRLQKIPGSDPVYLMELEHQKIQLDIAGLLGQTSVKRAIAKAANKIIPNFKARLWQEITQLMLDACTDADGTDDLQFEGGARILLERYLSDKPAVPSSSIATRRDIHKPVIFKGQVTVHSMDLQLYLGQTGTSNAPIQKLAAMLTALGAREVRIREGLFRDQSRWGLPVEDFPPLEFGTPESSGVPNVG